ncbi:MAG TPA: hypothetical protein VGB17_03410 [Pyrinomonadaceae bacterium]|jgi:hypothetical protein
MPHDIKVVLFEDTEQTQSEILAALNKYLAQEGSVIPFNHDLFNETEEDKERMYEDRLESILAKSPYDSATLVVADRDLSKSQGEGFVGLSVNSVAAACRRLAIPVCAYARQLKYYDWRGRLDEGHIALSLSEGEDELARKAAIAARGFAEIKANLPAVKAKGKIPPAKLLAALLGKPEYSDKIALYAVGDQERLTEIPDKGGQPKDELKEKSTFLGYWLWDSLLHFPGLFVDEAAAASYLNIETESFPRPDIQAIFEAALYQGPFADPMAPHWWRGMLDDIVSQENCADGLELVQRRVDREIRYCPCSVDPSRPAGYYCIISRQPVSLENSKGGLSWFPRGADLTRISNPMFEEYEPWLGT